jgi:hypothetical protein
MVALEIPDDAEAMRAMSRGQLEAHAVRAERMTAAAPPDVSAQLRTAGQAKADAQAQAAEAKVRGDAVVAEGAGLLAAQHAGRQADLEGQMAAYEKWSASTAAERELGGKARAELDRRGYEPPPPEYDGPRTASGDLDLVAWWKEFESDIAEVERAIDREHQAALDEGRPWPPQRQPQPASGSGADVPESVVEAGGDTRADPEPAPTGIENLQARTSADPRAGGTASSRDAQPPPPSPDPDYVPWSAWQPGPEDEANASAEDEADLELRDGTVDAGNEAGVEADVEGNEADVEPDKEPDPDPGQAPDRQAERVAALSAQLDELSARADEVIADRAGRQAGDDYHVQRQAEVERAAAAEPEAEPAAAPADYIDAGMDMEPG